MTHAHHTCTIIDYRIKENAMILECEASIQYIQYGFIISHQIKAYTMRNAMRFGRSRDIQRHKSTKGRDFKFIVRIKRTVGLWLCALNLDDFPHHRNIPGGR